MVDKNFKELVPLGYYLARDGHIERIVLRFGETFAGSTRHVYFKDGKHVDNEFLDLILRIEPPVMKPFNERKEYERIS